MTATSEREEIDTDTGEVTQLMQQIEHGNDQLPVLNSDASLMMNPAMFEHMQRVCKVYAASSVVPQQFQGNVANCMIAMELAYRMKVNVFMLMQAMYVVSGKPGLEGKMAIALVNVRGPFRGPIQYVMTYDKANKPVACTAWAVHKATGERCETSVTWDVVVAEGWDKKPGSKWKTMPEQMFKYRSASWLARTYCPEVLMGMLTAEELHDTYDGTRYVESTAVSKPQAGRHKLVGPGPSTTDTVYEQQPTQQDEEPDESETEPDPDVQPAESEQAVSGGEPSPWERLCISINETTKKSPDEIEKAVGSYCAKFLKCAPADLTNEQAEKIRKQINNGAIPLD